ncbi:uncharacterized protein VSU04_011638 [Chlamydotis macqueenii]
MADGTRPPPAPTPAGTQPPPQRCRAVRRVHAFGKGGQAPRRDPHAPPALRGWLHKQDSSGLRLWKRRWFVLVDLCLYYYGDSSEQRVRGGLPLPGYQIRVLPPAPCAPRFLFTAEHPGMRTYCLGVETPEELRVWVCALRRGAAPLPGSPLSLQMPQDPRGPPSPPLPPGQCSPLPPTPPPCHPLLPPLPPSKEEPPARGEPPVGATATAPAGRSPRKLRPPGATTNQQQPPVAGRRPEEYAAANQTLLSTTGSSDWLLACEGWDESPPTSGTASPPWQWAGASPEREGVSGRGARRPIRITLLQASF